MSKEHTSSLDSISKAVTVMSVIAGIVISILSFNETRQKDADARISEAGTRRLELQKYYDQRKAEQAKEDIDAARPFIELRQKLYLEALQSVEVLANPTLHDTKEQNQAKEQFWDLYWGELCMVETSQVESAMMALGVASDEASRKSASVHLAHAMRDSMIQSWGIHDEKVGPVNQ